MIRIALDTNILAYLAGVSRAPEDDGKIERCRDLLERLGGRASLFAPTQALGELFVVLRRSGAPAAEARGILLRFADTFGTPESGRSTLFAASDLVVDHRLQFWDALILSAAADAGCALLLSEDMQDGFVARGVTIANPLARTLPASLGILLRA